MYPGEWAERSPDRPAIIMAEGGETVTWAELDDRSNRLAQLFRSTGLHRGDHIALLMENHVRYLEVVWAALRAGLYVTPINWHLTAEEAAYIVDDCEARVLVTSTECATAASGLIEATPLVERRLMVDGVVDGYESYESAVTEHPAEPVDDESLGVPMFYSSGTTGRPKGVLPDLPAITPWLLDADDPRRVPIAGPWGFDDRSIYLSPAPLYHAAPLAFSRGVQAGGGTVVIMQRFDAARALEFIERYHVTHSQWVRPCSFACSISPARPRTAHDLSSHRVAIQRRRPVPGRGEAADDGLVGPDHLGVLRRQRGRRSHRHLPGRMARTPRLGRACRPRRSAGPRRERRPRGREGDRPIFFVPVRRFEYKGDPDKTAAATSKQGWITLGDIGHVDDGYLFLTDRASFMIISGGVNIYPREAEDVLIGHRAVADVGSVRRTPPRPRRRGQGRDRAARRLRAERRTRGRDPHLLPRPPFSVQVPAFDRLRGTAPTSADRQAVQTAAARQVLAGALTTASSDRPPPTPPMTNAPIHPTMRPPSPRLMTREFLILGAMSAVFFACTGAANALMPRFVVDELGGSETTAGIVMGSLAISSLLTRPWYGRLADRRGAKLLLVIGTVIAAAGYAVLLIPSTVGLAIVSRLIVGAGQAGLFVGMSMLAMQIAPDDRRSEAGQLHARVGPRRPRHGADRR